jgi:hypothetical protein
MRHLLIDINLTAIFRCIDLSSSVLTSPSVPVTLVVIVEATIFLLFTSSSASPSTSPQHAVYDATPPTASRSPHQASPVFAYSPQAWQVTQSSNSHVEDQVQEMHGQQVRLRFPKDDQGVERSCERRKALEQRNEALYSQKVDARLRNRGRICFIELANTTMQSHSLI